MIEVVPTELILWVVALIALWLMNPELDRQSFCLARSFDLPCFGCGIGHAISFAMKGQFQASFEAHFFGIPALFILLMRITHLSRQEFLGSKLKSKR